LSKAEALDLSLAAAFYTWWCTVARGRVWSGIPGFL
jgi:hypothetical protein